MDYKELAEMCRYLSDAPSYTAFHDEAEREVICDSCKGGLCYEKVQDAHWCMYEALQRAATAITGLLARAEVAEARAEKAERKRDATVKQLHGKWKRKYTANGIVTRHVCTNCNKWVALQIEPYKYCPNCGAKMDQ